MTCLQERCGDYSTDPYGGSTWRCALLQNNSSPRYQIGHVKVRTKFKGTKMQVEDSHDLTRAAGKQGSESIIPVHIQVHPNHGSYVHSATVLSTSQ